MKLNKIFALMLATAMVSACSDNDNNWNSSDVTVNMLQTEISVKENNGVFNVPVTVDGEMNGPIEVTVEVTETGENPAMEDVHYHVTQKTILVSAEEGQGNIEIRAVDDDEINEVRAFIVTITKVNGGNIGENTTTVINLKDNDSVFYEKMQANWKMNSMSYYKGETSWNVKVIGAQEGEEGYNEVLYITGVLGASSAQLGMLYHFDMESKTGYVEIPLNQVVAQYDANHYIFALSVDAEGYPVFDGSIKGTWNEDMTQITFDPNAELLFYVMTPDLSSVLGAYDYIYGITLDR